MEDVLEVYHEPYDEARPVICFDESSKALRGHERDPLPAQPGAVARVDHRYERNGKQRLHISTEPLTGWVAVEITEKRRKQSGLAALSNSQTFTTRMRTASGL